MTVRSPASRPHAYHLALALAAILLAASALSTVALYRFNRVLTPAVFDKSDAVAVSVTSFLASVLDHGVPFDELRGVGELLGDVVAEHEELAYAALTGPDGRIRHSAGVPLRDAPADSLARFIASPRGNSSRWAGHYNIVYPIRHDDMVVGYLHLGQEAHPVRALVDDILYDVLTVLLIAMLIAYELLGYLTRIASSGSMRAFREFYSVELDQASPVAQRIRIQAQPEYIRPALFLLVFAESLSVSFLPLFTEKLYQPIYGLSREMVIGLPISVFMLVFAVCLPWAGRWSDRRGRRVSFVTGALLAAAGLFMTALSHSLHELLLWRSLTAVGYALGYIACQGYLIDTSTSRTRAQSSSLFLSAFFAGSLSGAGIGGILAERIGYRGTFSLSAGAALGAALFVYLSFRRLYIVKRPHARRQPAGLAALLTTPGVASIILLSAIPAKLVLTGVLYYAGPVYLGHLGVSQSSIGRILLAYGISIIMLSPLMGRLADRFQARDLFIVGGGVLTSSALLIIHFHASAFGFIIGVAFLGAAHAIAISAQGAMIVQIAIDRGMGTGSVMGWFRFLERSGSVIGPLMVGACVTGMGFKSTFAILAIMAVLEAAILAGIFLHRRRTQAAPGRLTATDPVARESAE